jgi:hypothetical protein
VPRKKAIWLIRKTLNWFDLEGALMLESSRKEHAVKEKRKNGKVIYRYIERSYHVVFDRPVSWNKNVHIINWMAVESRSEDLKMFALMQGINLKTQLADNQM